MKKLKLSEARAKALYKDASPVERAILEDTFGIETFNERPLGVWCLTKDHHAIKPSSVVPGRSCPDDLIGVGVVTTDQAFIVHPGTLVVLPWGNPDVAIDAPVLFDTGSVDFETATRAIVASHEGVKSKWCDYDRFKYVGAPAACVRFPLFIVKILSFRIWIANSSSRPRRARSSRRARSA